MKNVLPILLCYILMTSQVFAISGGPFTGGNALSPIGTYSGVMIANSTNAAVNTLFTAPPVALGLFSFSVPTTNVATGAFLLFESEAIFTGNFDASVDPDNDQLAGVAFAYDYQQVVGTNTAGAAISVTEEVGYAVGSVVAKISNPGKGANSTARIVGQALLTTTSLDGSFAGGAQTFTVSGYRQSFTTSTISTLPTVITVTQ